jgi:hypothetical protein
MPASSSEEEEQLVTVHCDDMRLLSMVIDGAGNQTSKTEPILNLVFKMLDAALLLICILCSWTLVAPLVHAPSAVQGVFR